MRAIAAQRLDHNLVMTAGREVLNAIVGTSHADTVVLIGSDKVFSTDIIGTRTSRRASGTRVLYNK